MELSTIRQRLAEAAGSEPGKKALIRPDGTGFRYGDLIRFMDEAALFFRAAGISGNTRIAVITNDNLLLAALYWMILENAIVVPLDPAHSDEKLVEYCRLTGVDYVVVKEHNGKAADVAARAQLGRLEVSFAEWENRTVCRFVTAVGGKRVQAHGLPEDRRIAVIHTTSGTTSRPKIVPKTIENITASADQKIRYFGLRPTDVELITTGLFKSTSLNSLTASLFAGGCVMVSKGLNHREWAAVINAGLITVFRISPAVLNALTCYIQQSNTRLSTQSLRWIRVSGAPLPKSSKEAFEAVYDTPIVQSYGMTETSTLASTFNAPGGYREGSVGCSIGAAFRIVAGEILVRGANVFRGYEPEDSNQTIFTEGWFHTGDLGYLDEDGYVFITGRAKEMINRGGEKVSPYELEEVLLNHPEVTDAAVFPWPGDDGGEEVGAALVLRGQAALTVEDVRKHLSESVDAYKMPTLLYVVDRIPATDAGKVQRKALFEMLDEQDPSVKREAGFTLEGDGAFRHWQNRELDPAERLQWLWKELLNRRVVQPGDHFFQTGGDSLGAATLLSMVADEFGIQIPATEFYREPTIEKLAALINGKSPDQPRFHFAVPLKVAGKGNPLFCVDIDDSEAFGYRPLADALADRPVYGLRMKMAGIRWEEPITFSQIAARHIEEMKLICPKGPYFLIGLCADARLAGEIACQLQEEGKEVALLAMLDPRISGTARKRDYSVIRTMVTLGQKVRRAIRYLPEQSYQELPRFFAGKAKGILRHFRTRSQLKRYQQTGELTAEKATNRLLRSVSGRNHRDRFFNGKVLYFLPEQEKSISEKSIAAWRRLAKELEIIPLEGMHDEMIRKRANIARIAQIVSREMELAEQHSLGRKYTSVET